MMENTNEETERTKLKEEKSKKIISGSPMFTLTVFLHLVLDIVWPSMCKNKATLHGKIVIITGGNNGIGKETALDLAKRGAKVIIACRDIVKGEKAVEEIRNLSQNANVHLKQLDLASFSSIRKFADEILRNEPYIHILINNAGVALCPKSKTEDGFETQFGVNHLGHFLLTNLLLDKIKASAPARIINVSSAIHIVGKINFDDINSDRAYDPVKAYYQSKLANMLFTRELARRLKGTGITTYCLHPGIVRTDLGRHLAITYNSLISFLSYILGILLFKSPLKGAQTTIYCAVEESLANESGLYYCNCSLSESAKAARDDIAAKKLWTLSEDLVASVK